MNPLRSLTLWSVDRADRVRELTHDVKALTKEVRLNEVPGLSFEPMMEVREDGSVPGQPGADCTAGRLVRSERQDRTVRWWRIEQVSRERSGSKPPKITCVPMWDDLSHTTAERQLPSGATSQRVTLSGITAEKALERILSPALSAPDGYIVGEVDQAIADQVVWITKTGVSTFDLLRALAKETDAEWNVRWTGDGYEVDLLEAVGDQDATGRVIDERGKASGFINRVTLNEQIDASKRFTRVRPLGQQGQTIAAARWPIRSALYDPNTDRTTFQLRGDPIWDDGVLLGRRAQFDTGEGQIVQATHEPDEVLVVGDWAEQENGSVVFAQRDGRDLTALVDDAAERQSPQRERILQVQQVPPYANLLADGGHAADLSSMAGWFLQGDAEQTEEAPPSLHVEHGTAARRVAAGEGAGLVSAWVKRPADTPYVSAQVRVSARAGQVRLVIEDEQGDTYPAAGEEEPVTGDTEAVALSVGGRSPQGRVRIKVLATEADTVFYLDAATITQSGTPQPYAPRMGPRALWHEAATLLVDEGGIQPPHRKGVVFDPAAAGWSGPGFGVGDRCRVVLNTGEDFTTRVVAMSEKLDTRAEQYEKKITLSKEREDTRGDFTAQDPTEPPEPPENPPLPTISAEARQVSEEEVAYELSVSDPGGLVRAVEVRTGAGQEIGEGTDYLQKGTEGGTYEVRVPLSKTGPSHAEWRVRLREPYPALTRRDSFDANRVAQASYDTQFDDAAGSRLRLRLHCDGDEDTARHTVRLERGDEVDEQVVEAQRKVVVANPTVSLRPGSTVTVIAQPETQGGTTGEETRLFVEVPATSEEVAHVVEGEALCELATSHRGPQEALDVTPLGADVMRGQDLVIGGRRGAISVQVGATTERGAQQIPLEGQPVVSAASGVDVRVEGRQRQAELLVTPSRIQQRVTRRDQGSAAATLRADVAGASVTTLPLEGLRYAVKSGDELVLTDRVSGDGYDVTAAEDKAASDSPVDLTIEAVDVAAARAGSSLAVPANYALGQVRVTADEFEARVQRTEQRGSLGTLGQDAAQGETSVFLTELNAAVEKGDLLIFTHGGTAENYAVEAGEDTASFTSGTLPLASGLPADLPQDSTLHLPDGTSLGIIRALAGEVLLKATDDGGVAAVRLDADADGDSVITLNADYIRTGKIRSNNWSGAEGVEIDLDGGTARFGGSDSPRVSISSKGVIEAVEAVFEKITVTGSEYDGQVATGEALTSDDYDAAGGIGWALFSAVFDQNSNLQERSRLEVYNALVRGVLRLEGGGIEGDITLSGSISQTDDQDRESYYQDESEVRLSSGGEQNARLDDGGNLNLAGVLSYEQTATSAGGGSGEAMPSNVEEYLRVQTPSGPRLIPAMPPADTTPPDAPTNLSSSTNGSYGCDDATRYYVDLSWSSSADSYYVDRSTDGGSTWDRIKETSATSTTTTQPHSTTYQYRVRAVDASGNVSAPSSSVSETTPGAISCDEPE
jgi:hypothetical protein